LIISLEALIGLFLVLLSIGLMIVLFNQRGGKRYFRQIGAIRKFRKSIDMSLEEGKGVHVSLGNASILSAQSVSAFIGLRALERIALLASTGDRPVTATSGDGSLSILSQDALRTAALNSHFPWQYSDQQGRLAGVTPLTTIAGAVNVTYREGVSSTLVAGHFGPEVAYLCDSAERQNGFVLAASDSLSAQATLYASAGHLLIGEELFALPAYLMGGKTYTVSLRVQDILRWTIIISLLAGAVLVLLGVPVIRGQP
jgi:hypothetical protein